MRVTPLPIRRRNSKCPPTLKEVFLDAAIDGCKHRRHLLRLWLRDPENAWETPAQLDYRWAQVYDGITPETQVFPLEPYIRSESNKGR